MDFRSGVPRRRSVFQVYSKLYYEEKLRTIVNTEWAAKNPGKDETPPVPMGFRNHVVKMEFEKESDQVKNRVREVRLQWHRQALNEVGDVELSDREDLSEEELAQQRTARNLQR